MSEEELIIFCRLCNAIQLPIDLMTANVIFAVKKLVEQKGEEASMKDLREIVDNFNKQENQEENGNKT